MTVPPNYSMPSEYPPPPPGGGFGYGGQPTPPEDPKNRNWLIGGIVIGSTAVLLGSILIVALLVNRGGDDEDTPIADGGTDSSSAAEDESTPAEEETTEAPDDDSEIGRCLTYDAEILGDGLETVDCSDPAAFWTITNQSYDVTGRVDSDGNLTDVQVAYDLCGEEYGASRPGEVWLNWQYVYTSGAIDSMYCLEAIGNPDPDNPERTPYTPGDGDCFDDSDKWWTVECDSDLAVYISVGHVDLDEPRKMSLEEAGTEANCGGDWYWQVNDVEGRTTSIICGDEV